MIDGKPAARIGDPISSYGLCINPTVAQGSPTVFVNGIALAREGDLDTCNDPIHDGSDDVFADGSSPNSNPAVQAAITNIKQKAALGLNSDGTFKNTPENQYINGTVDGDGADIDTPANVASTQVTTQSYVSLGVSNGTLTSNTVPAVQPTPTSTDTTAPPSISGGAVDCSSFASYTNTEYPASDPIYSSLMLTPTTSLATFSTRTALWGGGDPKWLKCQTITCSYGTFNLTMPQILCNMANLALNCWEPIKAQYPNALITNVYRHGLQKQHGTGQAMDIQFSGVAPSGYLAIAQWIRDNISYNQLLLEVSHNSPWIHVSYYSTSGINVAAASKVGTMVVGPTTTFTVGLQQVA
jgi:hypothetical protein